MLEERNPQVKEAVVKLRRLSADEQTRWEYEMKEKARMDKDMFERWAREEGRRESDDKWQSIVAEKNAKLADKDAEIACLRDMLEKNSQ